MCKSTSAGFAEEPGAAGQQNSKLAWPPCKVAGACDVRVSTAGSLLSLEIVFTDRSTQRKTRHKGLHKHSSHYRELQENEEHKPPQKADTQENGIRL